MYLKLTYGHCLQCCYVTRGWKKGGEFPSVKNGLSRQRVRELHFLLPLLAFLVRPCPGTQAQILKSWWEVTGFHIRWKHDIAMLVASWTDPPSLLSVLLRAIATVCFGHISRLKWLLMIPDHDESIFHILSEFVPLYEDGKEIRTRTW